MDETGLVRLNRERHDAVAAEYDARHPEIHNPTEQRRWDGRAASTFNCRIGADWATKP